MCFEIIGAVPSEPTETMPINFNKKITCEMDNYHVFLAFLLITILLLIIMGCGLITILLLPYNTLIKTKINITTLPW